MRPKLSGHVFYMPTESGIYFRAGTKALSIDGHQVYSLWERLVPYLNGKYSLDALLSRLSEPHRRTVLSLLEPLIREGFIRDAGDPVPHGLSNAEVETYAQLIEFISFWCQGAEARFEAFRRCRVLCLAAPEYVTGLLQAAWEHGLKDLILLTADANPPWHRRAQDLLAYHRERDPALGFRTILQPDRTEPQALARVIEEEQAQVLLFAGSGPDEAPLRMLQQAALLTNRPLLALVADGDELRIGPWFRPGQSGCPICATRRRQAVRKAGGDPGAAEWHGPVAESLATAALVYQLFREITGISAQGLSHQVLVVRAGTLEISEHDVLPVPGCPGCHTPQTGQGDPKSMAQGDSAGGDWTEPFTSRLPRSLLDPLFGPLFAVDEGELRQVPVLQTAARVALPDGRAFTAIGYGWTLPEARARAIRTGLEHHALQLWRQTVSTPPEQAGAAAVAAGRTWTEVAVRGGMRLLCRRALMQIGSRRDWRPGGDAIPLRDLDAELGQTVLGQLAPQAVLANLGTDAVPVYAVWDAGRVLGVGAGGSAQTAIKTAILAALHRLGADADPVAAPFVPDPVCAVSDEETRWEECLLALQEHLRHMGQDLVVSEIPPDPVLSVTGLRYGVAYTRPLESR